MSWSSDSFELECGQMREGEIDKTRANLDISRRGQDHGVGLTAIISWCMVCVLGRGGSSLGCCG